jgi:hypothetical protein
MIPRAETWETLVLLRTRSRQKENVVWLVKWPAVRLEQSGAQNIDEALQKQNRPLIRRLHLHCNISKRLDNSEFKVTVTTRHSYSTNHFINSRIIQSYVFAVLRTLYSGEVT